MAGAATVAINTADVVVKSVVDGKSAVKPAGAVSIEAGRTLDWNEYGGAAGAGGGGHHRAKRSFSWMMPNWVTARTR